MPIAKIDKERTIQFLLEMKNLWPGRHPLRIPRMGASTGGIAQLVERQLCKLDVRGSSPRASTADAVGPLRVHS